MEPFLLSLSLLLLSVSAEILKVDPDSDQFFSGEAMVLRCEELWSVKRRTESAVVQSCGLNKDFGSIKSGCLIFNLAHPRDSGLYWCESAAGDKSPERPLSVTDRDLILDAPALPVLAGSDITLRCRVRPRSGLSPVLMKDGAEVQDGPEWNFTVSKEDEGEYSCRDKRGAESERRSLTVTDPPTSTPFTSSPPPPPLLSYPSMWLLWLVRPLLVSSPYAVCTVLLVLIYREQRRTGNP
ncbi:hypothetical protein NQD34_013351, partial [Periophthalmus magnuspinnatus]